MIFPAINLHLEWIFHGYVSHNQMVSILSGAVKTCQDCHSQVLTIHDQYLAGSWLGTLAPCSVELGGLVSAVESLPKDPYTLCPEML